MKIAACQRCAAPIVGKRSDAIFCGRRCRDTSRQARWVARNPALSRERCRQYSLSPRGTVSNLLRGARSRAKEFGVPFDLDAAWIASKLAPGVCEMSGLPLERVPQGDCHIHPLAPSLDRIQPHLGYLKSNVRVVCFAVNHARSDWGDAVLMRIAHALVANVKA